jgi:hypothetical protein
VLEETPWKWHGEFIYTDAKESTAHLSSAPNAKHNSQTLIYWVGADSLPSSEPKDTIAHSDSSSNTYRNQTVEDGLYYVQTWATSPSQISPTLRHTQTPRHTPTTKTSNTPHRKAYKTTNQTTRITHKQYLTTYYTLNIDLNTTNQTSSGLWDSS